MRYVYLRRIDGLDVPDQLRAIEAVGLTDIQNVVIKARVGDREAPKLILRRLSPDDDVVVHVPNVLADTPANAKAAAARILEAGASLRVVVPDLLLTGAMLPALHFAEASETRTREARRVGGGMGGRPPKLTDEALGALRADWTNRALSPDEVVSRHGVSLRTIYRLLGPRP